MSEAISYCNELNLHVFFKIVTQIVFYIALTYLFITLLVHYEHVKIILEVLNG